MNGFGGFGGCGDNCFLIWILMLVCCCGCNICDILPMLLILSCCGCGNKKEKCEYDTCTTGC